MDDVVINIENISKQYEIGSAKDKGRTFREALTDKVLNPLQRIRNTFVPGTLDLEAESRLIWALKDISLQIKQGEILGVIGRNGAGKSTLLRILSRITEPTEGQVEISGRVGSLLEVGAGFHSELTGRENVYLNGSILGMKRVEIEKKFDEIVAFAEIEKFIDTPVKRYSSGMYMRLAFAVAAHLEQEILLVDEVLAVGDAEFQRKCLGKMGDVAQAGRTILFVSHNMAAIQNLCTRSILLDNGKVAKTGTVQQVVSHYLGLAKMSKVTFDNKPIKTAFVTQVQDRIELLVEYEVDRKLKMPHLGFVFSDYLGNPICGSSPKIEGLGNVTTPKNTGTIKVILHYPKLLNGTYRVSLWFGDGIDDFFQAIDCLAFEVVNMTSLKQPHSFSVVGSVSPKCEWIFD
jgi:lipopolysaccharide transport system ATP-binding protein